MKTEDIVYKILTVLDEKLDEEEPNLDELKHDELGVTYQRWAYTLEMMQDAGLVKGVSFSRSGRQRAPIATFVNQMQITLRGVNYLAENSTTAKVIKAAKLLRDVIPGI